MYRVVNTRSVTVSKKGRGLSILRKPAKTKPPGASLLAFRVSSWGATVRVCEHGHRWLASHTTETYKSNRQQRYASAYNG